jgi:TatD DNase family protein
VKFVDAHVHLSDEEYAGNVEEVIAEAEEANVVAMVSNSVDLKTSIGSLTLAEKYPGLVYAALGIHPWNVQTLNENELQKTLDLIRQQKENRALVAVGEIGLDSKYEEIMDQQTKIFDNMLRLAEELDLPVVIHSRGMTSQIVGMLPSYRLRRVLLHWFSSPMTILNEAIERGCYISEGPASVYSEGLQNVVKQVPLERLLTETDGPVRYFKAPFMGKRTTPAFIPTVVSAFAEAKKLDSERVAEQMVQNFEAFFRIRLN